MPFSLYLKYLSYEYSDLLGILGLSLFISFSMLTVNNMCAKEMKKGT